MKKIYFFVAAAMTLAACSQEEILNDATIENVDMSNTLEATISANSRLNIEGEAVTWAEGDKIQGFDAAGNSAIFQLVSGTTFGQISGSAKAADCTKAIFPAHKDNTLKDGILTYNMPSTYTSDAAARCIPMYGEVSGQTATFSHYVMSAIYFAVSSIPEGCNTVKITASTPIAGKFTYDAEKKVLTGGDQKTIIVKGIQNMENVHIPVPAGVIKDLNIAVIDAMGQEHGFIMYNGAKTFVAGQTRPLYEDYAALNLNPVLEDGEMKAIDSGKMYNELTESAWVNTKSGEVEGTATVKDGIIKIYGKAKQSWFHNAAVIVEKGKYVQGGMIKVNFKIAGEQVEANGTKKPLEKMAIMVKSVTGGKQFPILSYSSDVTTTHKNIQEYKGADKKGFTMDEFQSCTAYVDFSRISNTKFNTSMDGGYAPTPTADAEIGEDYSIIIFPNNVEKEHTMLIKDVVVTTVRPGEAAE